MCSMSGDRTALIDTRPARDECARSSGELENAIVGKARTGR